MPSNLSADERAAVARLTEKSQNAHMSTRLQYASVETADLRTLLAVVARAGEPVADASKNIAIANRLTVFARELGRDHPRYITLLNAAIALEMSAIAHPAVARDRGDAARLEWLNNHLHEFGGGVVTDEHRVEVYIDYDLTVVAHGETLREAIDHAMHAAPAAPEGK